MIKFYLSQLLIGHRSPQKDFFDLVMDKWQSGAIYKKNETVYVIDEIENTDGYFGLHLRHGNNKNYSPEVVNTEDETIQNNPKKRSQVEPNNDFFLFYIKKDHLLLTYPESNVQLVREVFSVVSDSVQVKRVWVSFEEFKNTVKKIKTIKLETSDSMFSDNYELNKVLTNTLGFGDNPQYTLEVKLKHATAADAFLSKLQAFNDDCEANILKSLIIIGEDEQGFDSVFNSKQFNKYIKLEVNKNEANHYTYSDVVQKVKAKYIL